MDIDDYPSAFRASMPSPVLSENLSDGDIRSGAKRAEEFFGWQPNLIYDQYINRA